MANVEVEKTLSGYNLNFTEDKVQVNVSRLRPHTDGKITGDISLILGKDKIQEPTFNFNFSSDVTRKRLVNTLNEKYEDWQWLNIIDEMCRQIQKLALAGEDATVIRPTISGATHPGYYIEPVIMKGVPNIVYGDKGTNKTTICLAMLGLIALEDNDNPIGLSASCSGKVALLDWENNAELTDYTLSRLVEGQTLSYFELPYLRCSIPLADDMDRIGKFLSDNEVDLVMIDSLGQAAGSDRFDSAGKGAALHFFECLRKFNLTSLIIGQNAKDDTGKKSIYGSTYFTYYARNIFRCQADKKNTTEDEMLVALIHEEGNFSKKYQPIGFRLSYTDTTIKIVQESANLSQFVERVSLTRDLLEYLKSGGKTVKDIGLELALSDSRVRTLLSQLKSRGKVTNLGSGLWGLPADEQGNAF